MKAIRTNGGTAELARFFGSLDEAMIWTPDLVRARLVEMVRVVQVATRSPYPAESAVAWPEYAHEWGDLLAQVDAGTIFDRDERPRLSATRSEVTRAVEAVSWQARYLREHPGPAVVLKAFLRAKASRTPFGRAIRRNGWARATAYNRLERAFALIAIGLMQDGIRP